MKWGIGTHLDICGCVNTCLDWDLLFSSPEAGGNDDLSASLCSQPTIQKEIIFSKKKKKKEHIKNNS